MLLIQIVGTLSSLRRDNSPLLTKDLKRKSEGKAPLHYVYIQLRQTESKYTKQNWATKFDYVDYSLFCKITV